MAVSFEIRQVGPDKYPDIESIFIAQGLENNKSGVEVLQGYSVEVSDKLIGGAEVILQEGEYTFSVAVDDDFKGQGIGKTLFQVVKEEVRALGGKRIMIQAKVSSYWSKFGFAEVVDSSDVPESFCCDDCSRFEIDCFPKIMVLDL